MTILRMMVKIPLLSNYPLGSYSSVSISLHMSHHLLQKTNQCQRYALIVSTAFPWLTHPAPCCLPRYGQLSQWTSHWLLRPKYGQRQGQGYRGHGSSEG